MYQEITSLVWNVFNFFSAGLIPVFCCCCCFGVVVVVVIYFLFWGKENNKTVIRCTVFEQLTEPNTNNPLNAANWPPSTATGECLLVGKRVIAVIKRDICWYISALLYILYSTSHGTSLFLGIQLFQHFIWHKQILLLLTLWTREVDQFIAGANEI